MHVREDHVETILHTMVVGAMDQTSRSFLRGLCLTQPQKSHGTLITRSISETGTIY